MIRTQFIFIRYNSRSDTRWQRSESGDRADRAKRWLRGRILTRTSFWSLSLAICLCQLIGRANFSRFEFGKDPEIRVDTIRTPQDFERGPKDVFLVNPGEIVYLQGFFDIEGKYVMHCHMLEHEDKEMMHMRQATRRAHTRARARV
jgi:hypothetical protein